ncbi:MAG: hypothetical protein FJ023_09480 [Chloroflexi bacterium]|nr:hypothetical protein [Chloroflexota bacterium]
MTLDWQKYIEIADKFQHKAKAADRQDLRQDIILRLAEVANSNGHKPFTEGSMVRVASYTVMAYWRDLMRKPTILSLNGELTDGDGETAELWQTLADDKAIDLDAWLDARRWLLGCPKRLVQIAVRLYNGNRLDFKDYHYVERYRQKELKKYQLALT